MTAITRRGAMLGASAAVAVVAVPTIASAQPDPLRAGVQVLVNEIRQDLSGGVVMSAFWALQQAADRLEMLPGVQAIPNEHWDSWRSDVLDGRYGLKRVLRHVGGVPS